VEQRDRAALTIAPGDTVAFVQPTRPPPIVTTEGLEHAYVIGRGTCPGIPSPSPVYVRGAPAM